MATVPAPTLDAARAAYAAAAEACFAARGKEAMSVAWEALEAASAAQSAALDAEDARLEAHRAANPLVLTDEAREDAQRVLLAALEGLWVNRWTPLNYEETHVQALYDLVGRLELAEAWRER